MYEAKIRIKWSALPSYCVLGLAKIDDKGLSIAVSPVPKGTDVVHLIRSREGGRKQVTKWLGALSPGLDRKVSKLSKSSQVSMLTTPMCAPYAIVNATNCVTLDETATAEGAIFHVAADSKPAINALMRAFKAAGMGAQLMKAEKISIGHDLTDRQEEALLAALNMGFFEYPHKVKIADIAATLGIAPGTFDILLRKAQKKAIKQYLKARVP